MKKITTIIITLLFLVTTQAQVDYDTDIQPIFDANCTSCHFGAAAYTGGLDLTSYDELMEGGYTFGGIISTGLLEDYINTGYMPPSWSVGNGLSDDEINLINQWIYEGGNPSQDDIEGCTDPLANNFNPDANLEDGSCEYSNCTLSDGTIVSDGWSGSGAGNNWCNSCFCENGILSCTEIACGDPGCWENGEFYTIGSEFFLNNCEYILCEGIDNWSSTLTIDDCLECVDIDEDGICDDVDNCIGTWVEDISYGNCDNLTTEASCIEYGCSWTYEYTGVWLWEYVCGYQGNSTYEIDNSYCDETILECESDIDQDGICEDDCGDMPTIVVDCECSFFNPYTQTVFFTTVDEENCVIIDDCACECINDINENGICDEDDEGCWDDGEFYDVFSQLFVDECNYYECVVSSGFFWSELMTIDGCEENDCPCINPEWINPMTPCPFIYDPVIGCDSIQYENSCLAEAAGVTSYIDSMGNETVLEWNCEENLLI